jgi:hypothetical protein
LNLSRKGTSKNDNPFIALCTSNHDREELAGNHAHFFSFVRTVHANEGHFAVRWFHLDHLKLSGGTAFVSGSRGIDVHGYILDRIISTDRHFDQMEQVKRRDPKGWNR